MALDGDWQVKHNGTWSSIQEAWVNKNGTWERFIRTTPIDGVYSAWSGYSSCTVSCGGGTYTRTRTCTNPAPQYGGADCVGATSETTACNTQSCYTTPTITTGAEQTIVVYYNTDINLASGNIITALRITFNNQHSAKYRSISFSNHTPSWGGYVDTNYGSCSTATVGVDYIAGVVLTGRHVNYDDGQNGYGHAKSRTLSLPTVNNVSWSGTSSSPIQDSGAWVTVPSTSVSGSSSVNMATGFSYKVGSGACARLGGDIDQLVKYRTLTIS